MCCCEHCSLRNTKQISRSPWTAIQNTHQMYYSLWRAIGLQIKSTIHLEQLCRTHINLPWTVIRNTNPVYFSSRTDMQNTNNMYYSRWTARQNTNGLYYSACNRYAEHKSNALLFLNSDEEHQVTTHLICLQTLNQRKCGMSKWRRTGLIIIQKWRRAL